MSTDVGDAVREVFREVLGLVDPVDWDAVRYGEVEAWDSLVHMALVAGLESALRISLSEDDVLAIDSVDDAVRVVTDHLGRR